VGKKMNIFLQGGQKNGNFFSRSGVGKKMNIFVKVWGGQKNENFF
jgi:hypothetical protein